MSNILISTPPTSLATGLLQLDGGVAISSTPVYVADQTNTDSKLALSTASVNINTLTGSALMNIQGINNLNTTYSLSIKNSVATDIFQVRNDGYTFVPNLNVQYNCNSLNGAFGNVQINSPSGTQKLGVKGSGSTSATTTALFQNSSSAQSLLIRDDGNLGIGAVTTNPAYQVTQGRYGIPTYFICNTQLQDAGTVGQVVGNFQFGFSPSSTTASIGAIKCITDTTWYNGRLAFFTQSGDGTISLATEKMTLLANGNLMVNTTTDLGSKVGIKGSGSTSATTSLLVQNSSAVNKIFCNDDSTTLNLLSGVSGGSAAQVSIGTISTGTLYLESQVNGGGNGVRIYTDRQNTPIFFGCVSATTPTSDSITIGNSTNTTGATHNIMFRQSNAVVGGFPNSANASYPSAQFFVESTTRGFLPPRMTTGQKLAILTPASGLMVYDTSLNQMSYYNGAVWVNI